MTAIQNKIEIQSGESTQSHDQEMTPTSFRTTNITKSTEDKLNPELLWLFLMLSTPIINLMDQVEGVEPSLTAWKAVVLTVIRHLEKLPLPENLTPEVAFRAVKAP